MRQSILFTISSFLTLNGISQTNELIDSLKRVLKNHTTEDSVRLNLLNELSWKYYKVNADTGIIISNLAIDLAKRLNDDKKLAIAYKRKGNHYIGSIKYTEADDCFSKSANLFEKNGDKTGLADVLNDYGVFFNTISRYSEAVDIFWKSLKISESINNESGIAKASGNIGVAYTRMGMREKSIEFFEKALTSFKRVGNKKNSIVAINNISNAYLNIIPVKNDKIIQLSLEAIKLANEISSEIDKANALNNLARAYKNLRKINLALENFSKSLAISEPLKNKNAMAVSYSEIAELYADANDSILNTSKISGEERLNKALEYQKKGTQIFHELHDITNEGETMQNLSKIYEGKRDYFNALSIFKQYKALHDSALNDKKIEEILNSQFKYERDKKEAAHNAEIKQQKIVKDGIAAGAGILALGGLISFFFYKRKRDAVSKQKEAELKSEISDTEMKALRAQMNPHFIFNSLNSIGDYIAKNNTQLADEYLAKFAKLMRLILENSEKKEVPLADDLKALELYMQLEAMRMSQKFTYQIKVDADIDVENTLVPPLLLQPFVENSIWHGISNKEGTGKILVHIKKEGEMINCVVEDDGIGRQLAAEKLDITESKKSLGMKITKARIDILNKVKNATAAVQLFDLAQGTRVEVKLPLALSF
jgi:tetratricopeptide (TPR) repeat protein